MRVSALCTLLALHLGLSVRHAQAVTLPYSEDFSGSLGAFAASGPGSVTWSQDPVAENLRVQFTAANVSAACTVPVPELGGAPATAKDFHLVARLRLEANTGPDNTVGVGFLGADSVFTGSSAATAYYLADLRPGRNSIRLVRVNGANAELIATTPLSSFTLTTGVDYTLTVTGTYNTGTLGLEFSVSNGAASQSFFCTDPTPLTGTHFGLRPRTNAGGTVLDARFDYFHLSALTELAFTTSPPLFARVGEPYAYTAAATNSAGQAATLSAPARPAWLALAGETLTGVPGPSDAGPTSIRLVAADGSGGQAEQEYTLTVLPGALREPLISEFMADNHATLADEDGEASDWLEIFNPSPAATNLAGWALSDDPALPMRWLFPTNAIVPAHGFLVVFASGKNRVQDAARLHTNFKLASEAGEALWLRRPDGSVASMFNTLPAQRKDVAYGVYGDYGSAGYLLQASPGAPNPGQGYLGFVGDTRFSVDRGFYTNAQSVVITCDTPGATLVYTLDGSTPSLANGVAVAAGSPTNGPVVVLGVASTTVVRAGAFLPGYAPSGPDTHTYVFLADVVGQSPTGAAPPGWPTGPVNGQVLDYGMDPDVVTPSPAAVRAALTNLATVSIVTDLGHLFNPSTGIYVNGYGREEGWERPCSVEWIDPAGRPGFQVGAGIRIRGGASRAAGNPKHGFHLYFRSEYGDAKLHFPLFGDEGAVAFDRIDLRTTQGTSWHNSGSANAVYTRDEWSRLTQRDLGHPYKRSRYVHLYLDGRYWGIYNLDERADDAYASTYFGGARENYDVIKTYVLPHRVLAADGDALAWNQLHALATGGFTNDAPYFAAQGLAPTGQPDPLAVPLVDLDNLIDYMLICFYTGNTDGPVNPSASVPKNFYAIRARDGSFGFRFFAHDFEDTFNGSDVSGPTSVGTTLTYFNPRWLHLRLADHPRYRQRFADRAQRAFFNGGALDTPAALARWRALRGQLSGAILAESARWGDAKRGTNSPYTVTNWNSAHNTVETTTIPNRKNTVIGQLRARGLFPSINAPTLSPFGGALAAGQAITIISPEPGLFYTLDGGDPSAPGAQAYTAPLVLPGPVHTVRARARSAAGEWSAGIEAVFTVDTEPAAAGNLVISEIHYHPADPNSAETLTGFADEGDFEFLELLNVGSRTLDLSRVTVTNAVTFSFARALAEHRVLEPGARLLLASQAEAFALRYPGAGPLAGEYQGKLSNSGETIEIRGAGGVLIFSATYGDAAPWPLAADGGGASLVLNQPGVSVDVQAPGRWRPHAANHGQPGQADAAPFPVDPQGDADGDDLPNLLEYALAPAHGIEAGLDSGHLVLRARRNLDADGFGLIPERSANLLTWDSAAFALVETLAHGDGTATQTWRSLEPAGPGTAYVRLRVQP